jgi:uncharacterized protein (DUF433 family)
MITKTSIICSFCGKKVEKIATEIKRQQKRGKTLFYCGLSCAGKSHSDRLKKYIEQNTEVIKQYCDNRKDEFTPFRYHLRNAKRRSQGTSRSAKKDFNLSLEDIRDIWNNQNGKCAVTSLPLVCKTFDDGKNKNPYQASLDRINNNKGYSKDNVRFVCLIVNYARNNFSDEQVIEFFNKLANNA